MCFFLGRRVSRLEAMQKATFNRIYTPTTTNTTTAYIYIYIKTFPSRFAAHENDHNLCTPFVRFTVSIFVTPFLRVVF